MSELKHAGVKGMKWGVRKDRGHDGETVSTKKLNKLDRKFEASATSSSTWVAIHNAASKKTNANDVDRINNKPEYKNVDFRKSSPLRDKYYKEHMDAHLKNVISSAEEMGTNASGTKKYGIRSDGNGNWVVSLDEVKHEANDVVVKPIFDKMGRLISVVSSDQTLVHAGVKGMKWGVRKDRKPESADSLKTKALKKQGISTLSNNELKSVNERLNLERNFHKMSPGRVQTGKNIAKGVIAAIGTGATLYNMYNGPAGKAAISVGKKILRR